MKKAVVFFLLVMAIAGLFASYSYAEPNYRIINVAEYSGLARSGYFGLTFRLYDAETGGNLLWEETANVYLSGGNFRHYLGSVNPLPDIDYAEQYWIEVTCATESKLYFMAPLTAVTYSFYAETAGNSGNADTLDGLDSTDFALSSDLSSTQATLDSHMNDTDNPHSVTAAQAGASPLGHDHDSSYVNTDGDTMTGTLTVNSGGSTGIYAQATFYGVRGTDTDSGSYGYLGYDQYGVYGYGPQYGLYGISANYGVYGVGNQYGLYGNGPQYGLYANAGQYGVYGRGATYGVYGYDTNSGSYGYLGYDQYGVYGNGPQYGLYGLSANYGVYGRGNIYGVMGEDITSGSEGYLGFEMYGVYGTSNWYGVYGFGNQYGVYGVGNQYGLYGNGPQYGLYANAGQYGVYGRGNTYGVMGEDADNGTYGYLGNGQYGLYGSGDGRVTGDMYAQSYVTTSSRRYKTNVSPLEGALGKVLRLTGVSYDLIEGGKHEIGLIAEDVGEVVPEVVAYEENGVDAVGLDYARLVALLIEAVKEQQAEINSLKALIAGGTGGTGDTGGTTGDAGGGGSTRRR